MYDSETEIENPPKAYAEANYRSLNRGSKASSLRPAKKLNYDTFPVAVTLLDKVIFTILYNSFGTHGQSAVSQNIQFYDCPHNYIISSAYLRLL